MGEGGDVHRGLTRLAHDRLENVKLYRSKLGTSTRSANEHTGSQKVFRAGNRLGLKG